MGLAGMAASAVSFVAGAIMYWALTPQATTAGQSHGFRFSTIGVILMIAGAVGFVASAVVFAMSRKAARPPARKLDRQVVDTHGNSRELHETQR